MPSKKSTKKKGLSALFSGKRSSSPDDSKSSQRHACSPRETGANAGSGSIISARDNNASENPKGSFRVKGHRPLTPGASLQNAADGERGASCESGIVRIQGSENAARGMESGNDAITQPLMTHGGFSAALGFRIPVDHRSPTSATKPTPGGVNCAPVNTGNEVHITGNNSNSNTNGIDAATHNAAASTSCVAMPSFQQIQDGPTLDTTDGAVPCALAGASIGGAAFSRSGGAGSSRSPMEAGLISVMGTGISSGASSAGAVSSNGGVLAPGAFGNVFAASVPQLIPAPPASLRPVGSVRQAVFSSSEITTGTHAPSALVSPSKTTANTNHLRARANNRSTADPGLHSSTAHSLPTVLPLSTHYLGFGSSLSLANDGHSSQSTDLYLRSTNFLRGSTPSRSAAGSGTDTNLNTSDTDPNSASVAANRSTAAPVGNPVNQMAASSIGNMSFAGNALGRSTAAFLPNPGASVATANATLPMPAGTSFMVPVGQSLQGSPFFGRGASPQPSQPMDANVGGAPAVADTADDANQSMEVLTAALTDCLQKAAEKANKIRAAGGNSTAFSFYDKVAVMSLYDALGLDEAPDDGRPSKFQQRLQRYRFPPPQMEKLNSMDGPDEETLTYMIGASEARRRARMAAKTQENLERSRLEPVQPYDPKANLAECKATRARELMMAMEKDDGGIHDFVLKREEQILGHRREPIFIAMPYGIDSDDSDFEFEPETRSPHASSK